MRFMIDKVMVARMKNRRVELERVLRPDGDVIWRVVLKALQKNWRGERYVGRNELAMTDESMRLVLRMFLSMQDTKFSLAAKAVAILINSGEEEIELLRQEFSSYMSEEQEIIFKERAKRAGMGVRNIEGRCIGAMR